MATLYENCRSIRGLTFKVESLFAGLTEENKEKVEKEIDAIEEHLVDLVLRVSPKF